jgi:hypothetical protein
LLFVFYFFSFFLRSSFLNSLPFKGF